MNSDDKNDILDGEVDDLVIGEALEGMDPAIDDGIPGRTHGSENTSDAAVWDKRSFARDRPRRGRRTGGSDGAPGRTRRTTRAGPQAHAARGPTSAITALGYVRVSTDEQATSGAGLTAQRAAIEAEAARRGWELLDVIEDAGLSGRDLRRPGIRSVLDALQSGRASALIVAKVDRLSRSMVDFTALMDRSVREGWSLVALDLGVDTSTPSGEAMAHVMATFSQLERRMIGQRTREALAVKRAQGVRLGRPPTLSDALVQRMCRERAAGATLQAIADGLDRDGIPTAQGGRCWHATTVRDVIRASERRTGASGKSRARSQRPPPRRVRVRHRGGRSLHENVPASRASAQSRGPPWRLAVRSRRTFALRMDKRSMYARLADAALAVRSAGSRALGIHLVFEPRIERRPGRFGRLASVVQAVHAIRADPPQQHVVLVVHQCQPPRTIERDPNPLPSSLEPGRGQPDEHSRQELAQG